MAGALNMRKTVDLLLIASFLLVDFLFFHDIFKQGEIITPPQYLTGLLSAVVMLRSLWSLRPVTLKPA